MARSVISEYLGLRSTAEVARAQVEALTQRVPILYGLLCFNVLALAYTHLRTDDNCRVVVLPLIFTVAVVGRAFVWVRMRPSRMPDHEIRHVLRTVSIVGPAVGGALLVWALTLHGSHRLPDGPDQMSAKAHVVFFVGVTMMACLFLLMHLRAAAVGVWATVLMPFVIYLCATGRPIETAIGLNAFFVGLTMLYVAFKLSRHFEQAVVANSQLLQLNELNAGVAGSDMLTALPNRRQFFAELQRAEQRREPFAVIVCDLDGFKQVNDVHGHNAGDEVLCHVAGRLLAAAPETSCVARMGGDEFTCLLVGSQCEHAEAVAKRLIETCSVPIVAPSFTTQVGASAGICICRADRPDGPSLAYERADYAMFEAKKAGRGCVELFSLAHDESIRRDSRIAHLLRSADLASEIVPAFQPVVDARTGEIVAFEALARWISPELGAVSPGEFIPIAERTSLIHAISRQMLRAALSRAATWPEAMKIKVNLSVRDLMSIEQIEALMTEIAASGLRPSRLALEVTETIFAESIERVRVNVGMLRKSGCRIAIDDFGIGYSSLNYVHLLEPDVIKIDRCFVKDVKSSNSARRIVRAVIELARNVGALTVAEGVETADQARCLSELGCDELQGYLFSRPVSAEQSTIMAWQGTAWQQEEQDAKQPVTAD